mgnify:CR=1 FL=1
MIDELKPYPVAIGYNWPIDDLPTERSKEEELSRKKKITKQKEKKKEEEDRKRRRQKKHLSDSSSDGDEETETSMDDLSDNGTANQEMDSNAAAVRRSSRLRRNVTYKIDVSDDDEDPSANAKEEIKQNEGEKKNEDDVQTGDSVDMQEMQEKQKLADFFKVRID